MSESDTMFNERDRKCPAVQRTVQRAQGDENKVFGYGYGLWCGFK